MGSSLGVAPIHLWIVLEQFQGRIEARTYEQAWHYSHPELCGAHWIRAGGLDMRKGFTRKPRGDEPATPSKNYITPGGLQRLKDEYRFLLTRETPGRDGGGGVGCEQRRSQ